VWVEISNKNSKNIVCGCIYRHPHYDFSDFLFYLEAVLKTVACEGKEVYICDDFNIDLLKVNEITKHLNFYNLFCSYGFVPLIIHPSRVVENQQPSLIDNIFSNNINDEIYSGNIYLSLSEHFSQFASIARDKVEIKKFDVYDRDYSNYSPSDFRDDVSIQTWNLSNINTNCLFSDFLKKIKRMYR